MNNLNGRVVRTFEDYKNLSKDQQEFWQFEQLLKISTFEQRFAAKWVEKVAIRGGSVVLLGVLVAVVSLVIMK